MNTPNLPKEPNHSGEVINKLLTDPVFTLLTRDDPKRKIAFGIIRRGDPDLDKSQVLKERFLKILNSDVSVSESLGTPLNIFVSRLAVSDIVRTVLMMVLIGANQKYRSYFIPFVTDREAGNRARNIEILLDFAEAVMLGNDQVDSYLAYLAKNQTPPLTFSEWQKSLSSAPIGSPQTIIPSARETTLTPDQIKQFRNYVTRRFIFEEPGGQIPLADAMEAAGYTDLGKFIKFIIDNTNYEIRKIKEVDNLDKNAFRSQVLRVGIDINQYQLRQ
jgi:hypothetical protein